jgi:synaptic vesicle membrane protein VAT-1
MHRAIKIFKAGEYRNLKIVEIAGPPILPEGSVRISVKYIGVNYADCLVRLGLYQSAKDNSSYPIIPGFEFSGIVTESKSSKFKVSDCVFGINLFGCYQEEISINENYIYKIPSSLNLKTASSVLVNFLTAYYLLYNLGNIQKEEKILIRNIAGGVGGWLRILGKANGCKIFGTTSNLGKIKKIELLEKVYLHKDFIKEKFDIICNAEGGQSLKTDFKNLNKNGRLLVYGFHKFIKTNKDGKLTTFSYLKLVWEYLRTPAFHPFNLVNQNKSVLGCNISYLFKDIEKLKTAMDYFFKIIENVELPEIAEFKFEEVEKAHEYLESGKSNGKIVLSI